MPRDSDGSIGPVPATHRSLIARRHDSVNSGASQPRGLVGGVGHDLDQARTWFCERRFKYAVDFVNIFVTPGFRSRSASAERSPVPLPVGQAGRRRRRADFFSTVRSTPRTLDLHYRCVDRHIDYWSQHEIATGRCRAWPACHCCSSHGATSSEPAPRSELAVASEDVQE